MQKSLMKTELRSIQKSSTQYNFATDVEIINVNGAQLTHKSLMKIELLPTKKSSMQHHFTVGTEIVSAIHVVPDSKIVSSDGVVSNSTSFF